MALRPRPKPTSRRATWQDVPPNPNPWGPRPKPFRVFAAPGPIVRYTRQRGVGPAGDEAGRPASADQSDRIFRHPRMAGYAEGNRGEIRRRKGKFRVIPEDTR